MQTYQVTANLTGLTANVPESVEAGKPLSFTLAPEKGYGLPAAIQVTMGGQNLLAYQYAYDLSLIHIFPSRRRSILSPTPAMWSMAR